MGGFSSPAFEVEDLKTVLRIEGGWPGEALGQLCVPLNPTVGAWRVGPIRRPGFDCLNIY